MSIDEMMRSLLPPNRKERYYTGTVLPMLLCSNNFQLLGPFLSQLGMPDDVSLRADSKDANFLFFTEYGLAESLISSPHRGTVKHRDTPDILILIDSPQTARCLIAIEAKMFHVPSARGLESQMKAQEDHVISWISENMQVSETRHFALLPEPLLRRLRNGGFDRPAVTWEQVLELAETAPHNAYFSEVLRIALGRYDELVGQPAQAGGNCERRLSGAEIIRLFSQKDPDLKTMGRQSGINGDILREDIVSGAWRDQDYETSSKIEPPNRNWFKVESFSQMVTTENMDPPSGDPDAP